MPAPPVVEGSGLPDGMALASYGARAWAATIDFVVRLLILIVPAVSGAVMDAVVGTSDVFLVLGLVAGLVVAYLLYAPFLMASNNGQTWGHRAAGIRVVRRSGAPLSFGKAFVREALVKGVLIEWLGGTIVVVPILNYLWPLWDARNEALHDKICETVVVEA